MTDGYADPNAPVPTYDMPQSPAPYSPGPYTPRPVSTNPGFVFGLIGFILSFFFVLNIAGLVLSIIGRVKSKRAGQPSALAVAGIVISIVGILATAAVLAVSVPLLVHAGSECARLGNGVHRIGNSVYTCTPTSFNETTN